ncbi:uncharacterized protein V1510DRAFT_411682 [Dipodascopsis tothii]|uniref:uncharacterized protein n=1 Tax=Dipodascopsis tothii TaxID=44089 RepID=UPI0034D00988
MNLNSSNLMSNPSVKNIRDTIQNISIYDVKAYVRKAQNVMMNYSLTEAKVREATNNEPWGASSTLMQEIADGTFNYTNFNEIMPMIYKRFTEKTASEWRQIYKALQLLEFLVKHGSERVVDDARAHMATLSLLRSFHYIDSNGKDQGINVRNRSKELIALLGDDEKIRTERKKARGAKNKYTGTSSADDGNGFGGTGKKYGGFGSEAASSQYGGYSGGVYGDGGGFTARNGEGSSRSQSHYTEDRPSKFEPYDPEEDDGAGYSAAPSEPTRAESKAPEADLFSFNDDPVTTVTGQAAALSLNAPAPATTSALADLDDEFADFQSATPAAAAPPAATPNFADLYKAAPTQPTAPAAFADLYKAAPAQPLDRPAGFNMFEPVRAPAAPTAASYAGLSAQFSTTSLASPPASTAAPAAKAKKDDAFGSLWTTASSSVKRSTAQTTNENVSIAALAQKSAQDGLWSQASAASSSSQAQKNSSSGLDDLLF